RRCTSSAELRHPPVATNPRRPPFCIPRAGVGGGEQILLFGLVVAIHSGKRTAARGDHWQKRLREVMRRSQGRFKILYVALDCGVTPISDGTGTGKKADNIRVVRFLAGG